MASYPPPPQQHDALMRAALRSLAADHYEVESDPHADAESEYAAEQLALAARELVRAVDQLPDEQQPIGWDKPDGARRALVTQLASAHSKVARLELELAGVSFPPDRYVLAAKDNSIRLYCRTCATGNPEDYVCEWWEGREATTPFERPLTFARTHEAERHGRKWTDPAGLATTWTGPDGTVYDLGHGWRDAEGDVWVCVGWWQPFEGDPVPLMVWDDAQPEPITDVIRQFGPLTPRTDD